MGPEPVLPQPKPSLRGNFPATTVMWLQEASGDVLGLVPELAAFHGCHFLPVAGGDSCYSKAVPMSPPVESPISPSVESPHWGSRFLGPSCSQQKEQLQPEESWQPRLPLLSTSSSESAPQRLYQLPPPAFPKCLAGNRRGRATLIPSKAERLASSLPLWGSQGAMAFSLKSSLAHLGPVGHHNPQVPPPQTGQ